MSLTNQQVFDNALFGIRKQGYRKALRPGKTSCMYLTPSGDRCGIGQSVDNPEQAAALDAAINPGIESMMGRNDSYPEKVIVFALFKNCDLRLLADIQKAHDYRASVRFKTDLPIIPEAWEQMMRTLAADYHLTYTPVEVEA